MNPSVNGGAHGIGSEEDFSVPVPRPKTSIFRLVGEVLDHGGPGYLQFAITNIC
ncbi:MAG: radical SAM protein, partial [Verrucomicrobia bacterium]|nr:radical SAM protein [Verrucomicrobiota bacterium]